MKGLYHPEHSDQPLWRDRRAFLNEVARVNPEVLSALREDVFKQIVGNREAFGALVTVGHLAGLNGLDRLTIKPEVLTLLREWQSRVHLIDDWVLWFAHWTLREWFAHGVPEELVWYPDFAAMMGVIKKSEAGFGFSFTIHRSLKEPFIPPNEESSERVGLIFAICEVEDYLRRHLPLTYERLHEAIGLDELRAKGWRPQEEERARIKSGKPAEWLAYRQTLGWPWHCLMERHPDRESEASVERQTRQFAESIGLTERVFPSGPRQHAPWCPKATTR